jgi:hypothetical protein
MNFRPDQTSSTAQTFTSTSPAARPIPRTALSSSEVARPEAFFGQDFQSIPASSIAAASLEAPQQAPLDRPRTRADSRAGPAAFLRDPARRRAPRDRPARPARTSAALASPSFFASGVPEYPAIARSVACADRSRKLADLRVGNRSVEQLGRSRCPPPVGASSAPKARRFATARAPVDSRLSSRKCGSRKRSDAGSVACGGCRAARC